MLGCRVGIFSPKYTNLEPFKIRWWDASNQYLTLDENGVESTVGGNVAIWVDGKSSKAFLANTPPYYMKLGTETRGTVTYRYVKTHKITHTDNLHMYENDPSIKHGRTMFMVFRQEAGDHTFYEIFMSSSSTGQLRVYHSQPTTNGDTVIGNAGLYGEAPTGDTGVDLGIRVWAFRFENNLARCIFPLGNSNKNPQFRDMTNLKMPSSPEALLLGSPQGFFVGLFWFYEIVIFDTLINDTDMMVFYRSLMTKWNVS